MMEANWAVLSSAIVLGFVGSGHCLGMCGGIAGALGQLARPAGVAGPVFSALLYSFGRISSYALLGTLAGFLGESMGEWLGAGPTLRVAAGVLIIAFGFQGLGWGRPTARIEEVGLRVWRRFTPWIKRLGRPDRAWKLASMGALWGFLPCGLVYSALAAASLTGSAANGAAFMLLFGLGTLPALVVAAGASEGIAHFLRSLRARRAMGAMLIVFGCWTIASATLPRHGSAPHGRHHQAAPSAHHHPG